MKSMVVKLNENQLKQLAEFTSNLGLVFFATVVTPVAAGAGKINPFMITLGLILTILCLFLSLIIIRSKNGKS